MKVLVVGAGGREHAIILALKQSPLDHQIYIYPGNDGILQDAVALNPASPKLHDVVAKARENKIELVVIGPEVELVQGWADEFRKNGFLVFGPGKQAALLEGSKVYAKKFMDQYGISTAHWRLVSSQEETLRLSSEFQAPYVLKADGLAAGKGVFICKDLDELKAAAHSIFNLKIFGESGDQALLEEFKEGEELSLLAVTNGKSYELLPFSRDHKRLLDGDQGPNTGGMGVVAPITLSLDLVQKLKTEILEKTMLGFQDRGYNYRGVVFIGVMLTKDGPSVLEYNVRFGDPETQALLPLLDGDWGEVFSAVALGNLPLMKWHNKHAACVVLAAKGYPSAPEKGVAIGGDLQLKGPDAMLLHAGTKREASGFVTNGGRVLNVVAIGNTAEDAIAKVYSQAAKIQWPGMQFRRDIGHSIL